MQFEHIDVGIGHRFRNIQRVYQKGLVSIVKMIFGHFQSQEPLVSTLYTDHWNSHPGNFL